MIEIDNILDNLANRAYVYTFLKNSFYMEPTKDYIEIIKVDNHLDDFPFIDKNIYIENGVNRLKKYFKKTNIDDLDMIDTLKSDYTRMFIGPNDLPAPPWESSYLNEDKLLFQEETLQVRRAYLKYNYLNNNYPHEADDHIALELDFMGKLSMKSIELDNFNNILETIDILNDQKLFLENHLIKWVPEFTHSIDQSSKTDYFIGLSNILRGFIEYDFNTIEDLIIKFKNISEMED